MTVTKDAEPARESDSGGGATRRVQELADRCAASIALNDASAAGRLLRGDTDGLMSAIADGRK